MAGFLDKAKAAASDLAAKAETALNNAGASGGPDPAALFVDLGRMTYDEHAGRPVDPEAKARILAELGSLEQQGRLAQPPAGPPPPPGAAAAPPPPPPAPAGAAPPAPAPPAAPSTMEPPEPPEATPAAAPHATPPPPPPSGWPST